MIWYLEWLVIAFPLLVAVLNASIGRRLSQRVQTWIAIGGAAGSMMALLPLCLSQVLAPGLAGLSRALPWVRFWDGMNFIEAPLRLYIDALSAWMALVVAGVGIWGLGRVAIDDQKSDHKPRWLSLALVDGLLASILLIVLADNLWTVFLGWSLAGWCLYIWVGRERFSTNWLLWLLVCDVGSLLALGVLVQSFAHLSVEVLSVPLARARLSGLLPYESTLPAARPLLLWAMLSRLGLLLPVVRIVQQYKRRTFILFAVLVAVPGCVVWLIRLSLLLFPLAWWQVLIAFAPAGLVWLLVKGHAQLTSAGRFLIGLETRIAHATMDRLSRWLPGGD
ncbi:MAG: hypothetical protein JW934_00770 [Anaerolineae bacterium]|nr:hypothetical protein [Anaerolineae bacterium]